MRPNPTKNQSKPAHCGLVISCHAVCVCVWCACVRACVRARVCVCVRVRVRAVSVPWSFEKEMRRAPETEMRLPTHAVILGPNRSRQSPITNSEIKRLEIPDVAILSRDASVHVSTAPSACVLHLDACAVRACVCGRVCVCVCVCVCAPVKENLLLWALIGH
jgi:hypothetical protein